MSSHDASAAALDALARESICIGDCPEGTHRPDCTDLAAKIAVREEAAYQRGRAAASSHGEGPASLGNAPDLDDPNVVAVLRLPIAVSHLLPISDLMEKIYGPGLVIPSPGRFFVVKRPTTPTHVTTEKEPVDAEA